MNKVKGSPAIILALASVLAHQAERIAASDVTPTRTNRWFAQRYNVNNSQLEAAEVNMISRTRLCRAMKSGDKIKGYYWKFKE